jgi:hypothetical protein
MNSLLIRRTTVTVLQYLNIDPSLICSHATGDAFEDFLPQMARSLLLFKAFEYGRGVRIDHTPSVIKAGHYGYG